MSLGLTHFAVGASGTLLVETYLLTRVPYPRVLGILGGIWGMLPDVYWVSPVFRTEIATFHSSPLANVFWFHHAIDLLDQTDSKVVASVSLLLLFIVTWVSERRDYRALEQLRKQESTLRSEE